MLRETTTIDGDTLTADHIIGAYVPQVGVFVLVFVKDGRTYLQNLYKDTGGLPASTSGPAEPTGNSAYAILTDARAKGFEVIEPE